MAIPIYRNHSDRTPALDGVVEPVDGGGGNRTREPFLSEKVSDLFARGYLAKSMQQYQIEKEARLMRVDEQQIVRDYGKPPVEDEPESIVYLIADRPDPPEGYPVKVGYTRNIRDRLEALQPGSVTKLRLVAYMPGGIELERRVHEAAWLSRIREDWFEMCDEIRETFEAGISASAHRVDAASSPVRRPGQQAEARGH